VALTDIRIAFFTFDPSTGKSIPNVALFRDKNAFMAFAEKKFRAKYKIPANKSINATGLMFEDENSIFLKIFLYR
jgi:hypothetical protein